MSADIRLDITARDRASNNLRQVGSNVDRVGGHLKKLTGIAKMGGLAVAGLAAVGVAATAAWVAKGAASLGRIERIGAQTDAIIKSTGGAANITREGIDGLAGSLEALTGTEAESITEGANMLATFTGIRNESGKNNKVFDQAVVAMTDMNRAMDNTGSAVVDTRKQAVMLGKALNDPIKGVTALQKVGVSFTDSQKDQIKTLVESGDTMKAQKVILAELNKEFGGSAEAFGNTTKGKIERFNHAVGTLQETLAATLAPSIERVTTLMVDKGVPALERWGRQWNQHAVPAIRNGIRATKELWDVYKQDGITGLVQRVEKLTDTEGKLTPILDEVTLAGESVVRIVKELIPAFADAATALPPFLQPLQVVGDVLDTVADLAEAIPDPLMSIGVQAGIAALILPRLTAGVASASSAMMVGATRAIGWTQAMTNANTRTATLAATTGKLGGAARSAAGIGGMLALSQGMQETDRTTSTLLTTLGGAATGFAVGGPWGALIGGGAGLAMGLFSDKTDDAAQSAAEAKPPIADLASSFKGLSAAVTQSTRDQVAAQLYNDEQLGYAGKLGLTKRDLIDAILGEGDAYQRVRAAINEYKQATLQLGNAAPDSLADAEEAAKSLKIYLKDVMPQWAAQRRGAAAMAQAAATWKTALHGIPRKWHTEIKALVGSEPEKIERFARKAKLTPKQITVLFRALEVNRVGRDIDGVTKKLRDSGKTKPDMTTFSSSFTRHIGDFREQAGRGGKEIGKKLGDGTKGAKPDIDLFLRSLNGGVGQGKIAATNGSRGIGANMKSGFPAGFAGADGLWSGQVRGAVRSAINAGRAEAGVRSPSRKMMDLGKQMALGAEIGLRKQSPWLTSAGTDLIRDLVKGIGKEKVKAERVLDAVAREVERTTNRVKKLRDLRASYVSDFQGFASSVFTAQAPTKEDGSQGPQTIEGLLSFASGQATQAEQVEAAVRRLTGPGGLGLSPDLIKQLRSQGAGGIEQILALATGSREQIAQLNSYNKATNGAYAATGLGLFATQGGAADLRDAEREQRQAKALAAEVDRLITKRMEQHLERVVFEIRGDTLVAVLRRNERDKGRGGT